MEASMEQVEATLARTGRNCNTRAVERITGNAGKLNAVAHVVVDSYAFASQLAVLRNCPVVMGRLLKGEGGGSHLLAAKVLVLSRLLHKALSNLSNTPPVIDKLWERILSVRRKLLRRIDKRLASATCSTQALLETMCASALATSSTPTQLLHHFHKSRLGKMVSLLRGHDELPKHGTDALRLCIQTCQDTQTIFPRRLAESLARLKAQPLVQDLDLRALYELDLDIHDRWLGDEARNYTPWPRHDELQKAEAEKILHQWSKQAISTFLGNIKTALENERRLEEIALLRQQLLETWILSGSRMAGVKSANVLDYIRDTVNNHLESIVRSRAQALKGVVSEVSSMLASWSPTTSSSNLSLWTTVSKTAHLTDGAGAFKGRIRDTHQGRDESVLSVVFTFDAWMNSVLQVKSIVKLMKEARWDDTFADDVDDSDDDFGESRQTLLSDDDPRLLEEVTQEALASALQALGKSFAQTIEDLTRIEENGNVQQICFVMRVMREISERIPMLRLQDKATPLPTPFTVELIKPLHIKLARHIIQPSTKAYEMSLSRALKTTSNSHILWEGHPPLPAQPSPGAFRYIQEMTKRMAEVGSDLWAPPCVSVLKGLAWEEVLSLLQENLNRILKLGKNVDQGTEPEKDPNRDGSSMGQEAHDSSTKLQPSTISTERTNPPTSSADIREQKLKQAIFDALYVQRFIGDIEQGDAIDELFRDTIGLEKDITARLKKNAADHAKKTYLLFALLT
jgi:hypothetical protein